MGRFLSSPATRLEAELLGGLNAVAVVVAGVAWDKSVVPTLIVAGAAGLLTRRVGLSIVRWSRPAAVPADLEKAA